MRTCWFSRAILAKSCVFMLFVGFLRIGYVAMAAPSAFEIPLRDLKKIDAANVVYFKVLSKKNEGNQQRFSLEVVTRGGFKLYSKGFAVFEETELGERRNLDFEMTPKPKEVFDKFYKENRFVVETGTVISFLAQSVPAFVVRFESCSVSLCLLPAYFKIEAFEGAESSVAQAKQEGNGAGLALDSSSQKGELAISKVQKSNPAFSEFEVLTPPPGSSDDIVHSSGPAAESLEKPSQTSKVLTAESKSEVISPPAPKVSTPLDSKAVTSVELTAPTPLAPDVTSNIQNSSKSLENKMGIADSANLFVQKNLLDRSFWLFPALILAGLVMNLTPCVYPMIPITLNVMTQFGSTKDNDSEKLKKRRKLVPLFYFLGIVVTYSLMGVLAAMTGSLFGSLLQLVWVNIALAALMFFLGFAMLGYVNFNGLQALGNKVPLSQNTPNRSGFLMGGVSGLVSAPCTGPVLSSLMLLIGQTRDPVYGFALMSFFATGFGLPYVALGLFTDKIFRLPKIGWVLVATKMFFASLMFGLACYFLRTVLSRTFPTYFLYLRPELATVLMVFMLTIIGVLIPANSLKSRVLKNILILMPLSVAALWTTLLVTSGFVVRPDSATSHNSGFPSGLPTTPAITWHKNYEIAKQKAWAEAKPMVVDAWAQWCAACVKMDETTWKDPRVVALINDHFIAVKLDFTDSSEELDKIVKLWDLGGLPAIGLYKRGSDLKKAPPFLFREAVEADTLLQRLNLVNSIGPQQDNAQ